MRLYDTDSAKIRIPDGGGAMRRKKKKLWVPIILGFAVLYLAAMGLATWLVEKKFENDYLSHYKSRLGSLQNAYGNLGKRTEEETVSREKWIAQCEEMFREIQLGLGSDAFIQLAEAVYDEEGKLLFAGNNAAVSYPIWNDAPPYRETEGLLYDLSEYLNEEERKQIAKYEWSSIEKQLQDINAPYEYRFLFQVCPDTLKLYGILVQKITWEENVPSQTDPIARIQYSYNDYNQTGSEVVWEWKNEEVSKESFFGCKIEEADISFPYLIYGYDAWLRWEQNAYLHDFDAELEMKDGYAPINYLDVIYLTDENGVLEEAPFQSKIKSCIPLYGPESYEGEHWNLVLAMDSHPWMAAADYMKYVYLTCFALMLMCAAAIVYMTNKTDARRAAMEEMRRDFTNAMAHELKTPLSIIRGFAENLQERTMEEKRDYYLAQIIGQTEELDRMASEMIAVSRMDSEHLVLLKEPVSMSELFREQAERFQPIIREKNLLVQYDTAEDFIMEGDRDYLSKAVWNLISNAVAYNVPDGSIRIRTEREGCSIENTGFPLMEEQLVHAFDMFFRSGESRGDRDKHMGLGLYLTKKILGLHRMTITLENTETGVRAVIRR